MTIKSTLKLNLGHQIPIFGFGTWQLTGEDVLSSVKLAIDHGYTHIDTAQIYNNEYEIGSVLKKCDRKKLFITSKVWISNFKYYVEESVHQSLKRLNIEYIDLMLLHWPYRKDFSINIQAYKKLMELRDKKIILSIGVSNYTIEDLEKLHAGVGEWPAVNQIVFGPTVQEKKLIQFCKSKGIVVEGYSLLRSLFGGNPIFNKVGKLKPEELKAINGIALNHHKTPSQILIRWALQKDIVIFPKSKKQERIIENSDVFQFSLSKEEMKLIDKMDKGESTEYVDSILGVLPDNLETGLLYEYHFER